MRLRREVSFDPAGDLERISDFARRFRSLFRPAQVTYTPSHFVAEMELLHQARSMRLYLVTRPDLPVPLAILDGLSQEEAILLLALSPLDPDGVNPYQTTPAERRRMMQGAPAEPSGRGVWPFLVGDPEGLALIDLEPEGLVLTMARWGHLNVLDPEPLLEQRLLLLDRQIRSMARPNGDGEQDQPEE